MPSRRGVALQRAPRRALADDSAPAASRPSRPAASASMRSSGIPRLRGASRITDSTRTCRPARGTCGTAQAGRVDAVGQHGARPGRVRRAGSARPPPRSPRVTSTPQRRPVRQPVGQRRRRGPISGPQTPWIVTTRRQAELGRDLRRGVRERRDHAAVHVHGVGPQRTGSSARTSGTTRGCTGRSNGSRATTPVHVYAVAPLVPRRAVGPAGRGRGDDVHVVARGGLPGREGAHLRLDPAEPGRVAVTDVDDPHAPTLGPARADQPRPRWTGGGRVGPARGRGSSP